MIHHAGRVEVICGSMFCGKTEELIRRVRRAIIARQTVQVFKHSLDKRYGEAHVISHSGQNIDATPIQTAAELSALVTPRTTVVAIDEVQFFEAAIVPAIELLAERGIRVIAAGLDMDFRGEPFGHIPELMSKAEEVTKLQAICMECGNPASRTQRLVNGKPAHFNDPIIMVGATESYEPRCRQHHNVPRD
ncbi:MAG: thymidine kinase [Chloroflexota bacterium]|nr:thymidine kinase [Chloroflexota bacterium]